MSSVVMKVRIYVAAFSTIHIWRGEINKGETGAGCQVDIYLIHGNNIIFLLFSYFIHTSILITMLILKNMFVYIDKYFIIYISMVLSMGIVQLIIQNMWVFEYCKSFILFLIFIHKKFYVLKTDIFKALISIFVPFFVLN